MRVRTLLVRAAVRVRHLLTDPAPVYRSPYKPVRVKVAFHNFWPGFRLMGFLRSHPYLRQKYELVRSRRRPDLHIVSVFGPSGVIRNPADIPVPRDGRPTVFYTGERVPADLSRFDWSISFDESSDRNLYLPLWVIWMNRFGLGPHALVRHRARPAAGSPPGSLPGPAPVSSGKRGCAFIFRHRVAAREAFFDRLAQRMEIVAPSRSRNNSPRIRGGIFHKLAFLRHFRFNIAFENEPSPGYLTEKIVDPFMVGCVPIYLGDPHVERTFSPDAFIHVEGESDYDHAIERILAIDGDPSRLEAMRNAAPLVDNRLPDYATHDYAMAFFERIFDSAVRRG